MASIIRVNPLPGRAQGTAACKMSCSWQLVRGTPGDQLGAMLPKVQMPPLLLHRIVNRTELSALRAGKLRAGLEIQPDFQLPAYVHLALDHFPPTAQSQGLPEKNICVHTRKNLPARASPLSCKGHSFQVPPERLPRRAVRGLGAHSPIKPVPSTHSKRRGAFFSARFWFRTRPQAEPVRTIYMHGIESAGSQGSNSAPSVDNQELAKQDSQGASQNLSALDPDLQTLIAAWDKLPPALKSALLAIVSSHREAKGLSFETRQMSCWRR